MKLLKVNKWTILACAAFAIVSIIVLLILEKYMPNTNGCSIIQNILLGLFTGAIISCVTTIVGYIYAKQVLIEKASNNIKSLYINMVVHSKRIGNVLEKIHSTTSLENLPFSDMSGLSQLNINFLNNMELGLFSPIQKHSKLAKVYIKLIEFQPVVYNIKNISMDLETMVLQYTNQSLQIQNMQLKGVQPNPIDLQNLDVLKNLINIRTAKLHEHTTDRMMQLDRIAKEFFDCKVEKQSWEEIKSELLLQVESIVTQ